MQSRGRYGLSKDEERNVETQCNVDNPIMFQSPLGPPHIIVLIKETTFEWAPECQEVSSNLKRALSQPPMPTRLNKTKQCSYICLFPMRLSAQSWSAKRHNDKNRFISSAKSFKDQILDANKLRKRVEMQVQTN